MLPLFSLMQVLALGSSTGEASALREDRQGAITCRPASSVEDEASHQEDGEEVPGALATFGEGPTRTGDRTSKSKNTARV